MTASRTPFADLPAPQQAGIICNDPQFQKFAGLRTAKSDVNKSACAEYVRLICGVTSRGALATNASAAARFAELLTEFDAWRGRIAQPR